MIHVCFYCFGINDWKERLVQQIEKLKKSELYDYAESLHLFFSDPNANQLKEIENLLVNLPKIELNYTTNNSLEGFDALVKIKKLSKDVNKKILYFHTKGVFNKYKNFQTQELDEVKIKSTNCWKEMLEHFTIEQWKDCVEKLNEYDLVGMINQAGWWWGNFWWANSSYINNCGDVLYGSRWDAEAWLHNSNSNKEKIKIFQFYPKLVDYAYTYMPKYFYNKKINKNEIKINIKKIEYGYFGSQRDEGRPAPKDPILYDVTNEINKENEIINVHEDIKHLNITNFNDLNPIESRITYNTNIDPENEYFVSTFNNTPINLYDLILSND